MKEFGPRWGVCLWRPLRSATDSCTCLSGNVCVLCSWVPRFTPKHIIQTRTHYRIARSCVSTISLIKKVTVLCVISCSLYSISFSMRRETLRGMGSSLSRRLQWRFFKFYEYLYGSIPCVWVPVLIFLWISVRISLCESLSESPPVWISLSEPLCKISLCERFCVNLSVNFSLYEYNNNNNNIYSNLTYRYNSNVWWKKEINVHYKIMRDSGQPKVLVDYTIYTIRLPLQQLNSKERITDVQQSGRWNNTIAQQAYIYRSADIALNVLNSLFTSKLLLVYFAYYSTLVA